MFPRQPIKLIDCDAHGLASGAELFVVEGDSAAQAVARIRNEKYQAVLPMQGKPMNAMKTSEKNIRKNPFFSALVEAIGTDMADAFVLSNCRYQRIVLLFDPDADGIHCGTLALMFFYRWMRPLLEASHITIIRPPMMEIIADQVDFPRLAYSEEEGQSISQELSLQKHSNIIKRRFRGLASFNVDTLLHCCVKPTTRNIFQLTTGDAESSIELMSMIGEDSASRHNPTDRVRLE